MYTIHVEDEDPEEMSYTQWDNQWRRLWHVRDHHKMDKESSLRYHAWLFDIALEMFKKHVVEPICDEIGSLVSLSQLGGEGSVSFKELSKFFLNVRYLGKEKHLEVYPGLIKDVQEIIKALSDKDRCEDSIVYWESRIRFLENNQRVISE